MTSENQDTIEDCIICQICHKVYDDPRILSCSHTYCRKCLEETALTNKGQFECPLHEGFILPKNAIESLPINRIAHRLIDIYGTYESLLD